MKNINWDKLIVTIVIIFFGWQALEYWMNTAPLKISWRGSALDPSGLVMQVQNTSDKDLSCKMTAINYTLNQSTTYDFSLGSAKMQEIGIMEANWTFKSGETVTISTEGYRDLKFKVP